MCTCIKVIAQKQTNQAMQILVVYVSYWQCSICRVQKINRDYYSIQLIIYSLMEFVFSNSTLINPRESEMLFSAVFFSSFLPVFKKNSCYLPVLSSLPDSSCNNWFQNSYPKLRQHENTACQWVSRNQNANRKTEENSRPTIFLSIH